MGVAVPQTQSYKRVAVFANSGDPCELCRAMNYYHGLISGRKASAILTQNGKDGAFLIRDSQSQPGSFVLSVRYKEKVYHVLIFHEGHSYFLDSSGDGVKTDLFHTLDDLVVYGMAHELKVAGEEVHLNDAVACQDAGITTPHVLTALNGGQRSRLPELEDNDALTDLFAAVFGSHCAVLVVVHSTVMLDAQPLPSGEEYLCCIVKDSQLKAFYIRIVNPVNKTLVGEKRITKHFEYDSPSDLVLTFLSEHGITCVQFRSGEERSVFLRYLDRIIQLQQERAIRLRGRKDSNDTMLNSEVGQNMTAEHFNINDISEEWQYLFEQAGVTRGMLEDRATLQFILDTICDMGGAPQKLNKPHSARLVEVESQLREERAAAIAVDTALRHESLRASRLADELKKRSMQDNEAPKALPRKLHLPTCSYSGVSSRCKDWLLNRSSLSALAPLVVHCYCHQCSAGKPVLASSGNPPYHYTLPIGWCQFILRSQSHALAQQFCSQWHVAFSVVSSSSVAGVVRTGQLVHSAADQGYVTLTPDLSLAVQMSNESHCSYYDEVEQLKYNVTIAFQVFVQPGAYRRDAAMSKDHHLWLAPERTYIPYAMLILLHQTA